MTISSISYFLLQTIPEVSSEQNLYSDEKESTAISAVIPIIGQSTKMFPADAELPIADAASTWGNYVDGLTNLVMPIDRTTFLERGVAFSKDIINSTIIETTSMSLDNDVSSSTLFSGTPFPGMQMHNTFIEDVAALNTYTETNSGSDQDALRDATKIMANIEKDRIPCPRLCGASFSFGVGGITSKYYLYDLFSSCWCILHFDIPTHAITLYSQSLTTAVSKECGNGSKKRTRRE